MRLLNGRIVVVVGVALTLVSLLAFSLSSPRTTIGLETDAGVGAGAEGPADPPSSLPESGASGVTDGGSSTGVLLLSMLGALGVALTGAGLIANRRRQRFQSD